MGVLPVWPVDLEDDYNADVLRAVWFRRLWAGFADLGGPWNTYQPVVAGGISPDDNARFTGRWKRFGDIALVEQKWTVTSADSFNVTEDVTATLPFDVSAVGVVRLSGAGTMVDNGTSGGVDRYDFEVRFEGGKLKFYSPRDFAGAALKGDNAISSSEFGDLPNDVSFQVWILLDRSVSATGGTFDADLDSTWAPAGSAPPESWHTKVNVNCALPGTVTESTAQFINEETATPNALTVTNPVRRYSRVGDLGFLEFEWSGPVSGASGTATDVWTADLPSGWTLADSGDQWLGWAEANSAEANRYLRVAWVGRDVAGTKTSAGGKVCMFVTRRHASSNTVTVDQVTTDADWTDSSAYFRSGLLVCRLETVAAADALLMETGDSLLLESGDKILLE